MKLDIIKFLVEEGQNSYRHDQVSLTSIVIQYVVGIEVRLHCTGKLDIVKFLVMECHCDPGLLNHDGDTSLHYACLGNGNMVIVGFSLNGIVIQQLVQAGVELCCTVLVRV